MKFTENGRYVYCYHTFGENNKYSKVCVMYSYSVLIKINYFYNSIHTYTLTFAKKHIQRHTTGPNTILRYASTILAIAKGSLMHTFRVRN